MQWDVHFIMILVVVQMHLKFWLYRDTRMYEWDKNIGSAMHWKLKTIFRARLASNILYIYLSTFHVKSDSKYYSLYTWFMILIRSGWNSIRNFIWFWHTHFNEIHMFLMFLMFWNIYIYFFFHFSSVFCHITRKIVNRAKL